VCVYQPPLVTEMSIVLPISVSKGTVISTAFNQRERLLSAPLSANAYKLIEEIAKTSAAKMPSKSVWKRCPATEFDRCSSIVTA
jgi:hypothetical protein